MLPDSKKKTFNDFGWYFKSSFIEAYWLKEITFIDPSSKTHGALSKDSINILKDKVSEHLDKISPTEVFLQSCENGQLEGFTVSDALGGGCMIVVPEPHSSFLTLGRINHKKILDDAPYLKPKKFEEFGWYHALSRIQAYWLKEVTFIDPSSKTYGVLSKDSIKILKDKISEHHNEISPSKGFLQSCENGQLSVYSVTEDPKDGYLIVSFDNTSCLNDLGDIKFQKIEDDRELLANFWGGVITLGIILTVVMIIIAIK